MLSTASGIVASGDTNYTPDSVYASGPQLVAVGMDRYHMSVDPEEFFLPASTSIIGSVTYTDDVATIVRVYTMTDSKYIYFTTPRIGSAILNYTLNSPHQVYTPYLTGRPDTTGEWSSAINMDDVRLSMVLAIANAIEIMSFDYSNDFLVNDQFATTRSSAMGG